MDEPKRSGKIPAFGDWEKANDMPITQYFESARQAGLIRYRSNSLGDCEQYMRASAGDTDLYDLFEKKTPHDLGGPPSGKTREGGGGRERRMQGSREQRKQGKVCDITEPPPTRKQESNVRIVDSSSAAKVPKPLDEDLYEIPPQLLRSSKRKKLLGFFSCLGLGYAS